MLPSVLLVIGGLAIAAYLRTSGGTPGATTEASALVAALLGALAGFGETTLAGALAVVVTLLLTLKAPLHQLAGAVSEGEILAILKFGLVAVVLLPLLPTTPVGPYSALVPRHIGIVVVTLTGVSLGGYLLVRVLGGRAGWPLAGAIGGLVSSTAVTLSFSGKARSAPGLGPVLATGTLLASTILYGRSFALIFLFDRPLALLLAPRLGLLLVVGLALAALRLRRRDPGEAGQLELGNPVELGAALGLGVLFAAILVLARAAQAALGDRGLWAAAFVSGFVDVDSTAIAAAGLHRQGIVSVETAGASFLFATLSNLLVKAGIVAVVGGPTLARQVLPAFAVILVVSVALLASF